MNTRLAVIAGTLLVGVSLFVTSLISNNLNNNTLTTSSSAQEVSCKISGTVRQRNNGDGTRCFFYFGTCQKSGEANRPIRTNCYSTREEAQAAAQTACCGVGSAPTATPLPTATTAPGQPTLTPVPGSCSSNLENPGKKCGEDGFACCPGNLCTNTDKGATCGPKPTEPACNLDGAYSGLACDKLNCCSKKCYDIPGFGGYCAPKPTETPSPSPTPKVDLTACYNEPCKFGTDGKASCSNGRTCVVIGDPKKIPSDEFCNGSTNCRCVLNVQCALPGGYDPENKEKASCYCLNPGKCVPADGDWSKYACTDDAKCILIDPTFKCIGARSDPKGRPIFGTCGNDYCPDPTATPTPFPRPGFVKQPSTPVTEQFPYLLKIDRRELPRYILRAIGLQ